MADFEKTSHLFLAQKGLYNGKSGVNKIHSSSGENFKCVDQAVKISDQSVR